jgi:DNA-binding NarL/FixJ family response regulator
MTKQQAQQLGVAANKQRAYEKDLQVGELLVEGIGLKDIAKQLGVPHRTVKARVLRLSRLLGIKRDPRKLRYVQVAVELNYRRNPELKLRGAS